MKELMIKYYVNKFGTLTFSQLCTKNKDYSPSLVQKFADDAVANGRVNMTVTAHHKTGISVVKYHSLNPVDRKPKKRIKREKLPSPPQHVTDANRLKRIIARRPGISTGLLLNSAKWANQSHIDALLIDQEVICVVEKHGRTGNNYTRYYMNYDLPLTRPQPPCYT